MVQLVVRLSAFLVAKAVPILAGVVVSLSFSMASFVIPALASAVWSAAAWIIGPPVMASVTETQRLRQQNQALKRNNQDLTRRNRNLGERNSELSTRNQGLRKTNSHQAQANRVLRVENERLTTTSKQLSDQLSGHRRVTAATAHRIGQRAVRTTTRSIAAIPLESVPVLGVTTIIATAAWEIRDTCDTVDDMAKIQRELGQEPDVTFAARACDEIPLQGARVDHYGSMPISECRAKAEAAQNRVFYLAKQARDELPDLVEPWGAFDEEIRQAADNEFQAINEICDCIADLICDPEDLVRR